MFRRHVLDVRILRPLVAHADGSGIAVADDDIDAHDALLVVVGISLIGPVQMQDDLGLGLIVERDRIGREIHDGALPQFLGSALEATGLPLAFEEALDCVGDNISAGGFHEWDSNTIFSGDMLALSHLVDLASSDGKCYVSLALTKRYTLPSVIEKIATDMPEAMWNRKDDHYIALASKSGIASIRRGRYAYREVRSHADDDLWICQMGSKRQDGSFATFRRRVESMPLEFDGLTVKCTTLRGD